MNEKLILSIVTPEKLLVSEEVDQVNVPGSEGDMAILYDHTPILTNLRSGQLSYEKEGETIALVVSGGYLEVTDNRVIILAETGEFLHEIDRELPLIGVAQSGTQLLLPRKPRGVEVVVLQR